MGNQTIDGAGARPYAGQALGAASAMSVKALRVGVHTAGPLPLSTGELCPRTAAAIGHRQQIAARTSVRAAVQVLNRGITQVPGQVPAQIPARIDVPSTDDLAFAARQRDVAMFVPNVSGTPLLGPPV